MEEIDWIEINDETDMPPDDERYFFTLQSKDGGRRVICCRPSERWQTAKAIAWMHCDWPEPFGGERIPIEPEQLEKLLSDGHNGTGAARKLRMKRADFYNTLHKYPVLFEIWDRHSTARLAKAMTEVSKG